MKIKRRGVSDVITSLILILATVSLATVFFFWALGYMGASQSATGAAINQNNGKVQEQFTISDVRFWSSTAATPSTLVSTGDMVTVYVTNFGSVPIIIDHLYFNGVLYEASTECVATTTSTTGTTTITTTGNSNCYSDQFSTSCVAPVPLASAVNSYGTSPSLEISEGGSGCINICISNCYSNGLVAWNVGDTDTIEIASTRGNQFTQSFTVPTQNWG